MAKSNWDLFSSQGMRLSGQEYRSDPAHRQGQYFRPQPSNSVLISVRTRSNTHAALTRRSRTTQLPLRLCHRLLRVRQHLRLGCRPCRGIVLLACRRLRCCITLHSAKNHSHRSPQAELRALEMAWSPPGIEDLGLRKGIFGVCQAGVPGPSGCSVIFAAIASSKPTRCTH